ncbi:MAG TPA: ABC transporter permease [Candidatus Solibacter sp.]|nr:ABC transporter permease [Candidatus Solibacter sp.]
MKRLRELLQRTWSSLVRRRDEHFSEEINEHIAMLTEENIRSGMAPAEARRQAILKFGPVEAITESYRGQQGLPVLETILWDARHALRRLRRAPAFTIASVLTLALGIGASTSIFTLIHAVMLKSLPVRNPGELYRMGKEFRCCFEGGYSQENEFSIVSYDLYKYFRDNTHGFSDVAAFPAGIALFGVRRAGGAEVAQTHAGEYVSGNYFRMFGINPYAGRMLTPEDDAPGATPAMVMTYRWWRERFGADPSIVGSVFNVDGKPFNVVGIAPPGFFGDTLRTAPPEFFLPLNMEPLIEGDADLNKPDTHWLEMIGRPKPGITPSTIEAEMRVELKEWLRSHWSDMDAGDRAKFPAQTLYLAPGGSGMSSMRGQYGRWLQILMIASGVVLLIVCANIANLMLVRSLEGRRQISLSRALGAPASWLIRQPLAECLALSLMGGAAGVAVAFVCTRLLVHLAFAPIPGFTAVPIDAAPSMPVLWFAFGISLVTGIAFGIAPAWMATKVDPIEALRGRTNSADHSASFSRKALVVAQTSLSLVLLSASGLLITTVRSLEDQSLGFETNRRMVANINARLAGYRTAQLPLLYRRIHDAVGAIPGVSSSALCLVSPQSGQGWGTGVWVSGHPMPGPMDNNSSLWDRVSAGYLEVIGNPMARGRGFSEVDRAGSQQVAVVNEAFARHFFGDEDPIGKRFGKDPEHAGQFEIVGVVKDARYVVYNLGDPILPYFFLPEAQAEYGEQNLGSLFLHDMVIVTEPGATLSLSRLEQAMATVDPNLPVISFGSLENQVAFQLGRPRLIAQLTSLFGVLSLVLASIGLYGVTAYNTSRRVNEVGVRMALGASRQNVTALVLRGAFSLVAWGFALGIPVAFAAARLLRGQLYGLNPYSPLITIEAVAVLAASALVAALVPAVRASWISPSEALRTE